MKQFIIFILSLGVGVGLFLGYQKYLYQPKPIVAPKKVIMKPYTFQLDKAPTDALAGSLSSFSGDVYYQSRVASEPAHITTPIQLQQGEKVVTGEGTAEIQFPPIIEATMSANSELEFIQTIPTAPVFLQSQGSISYTKTGTTLPSIRTMRLVSIINDGMSTFTVDTDNSIVAIEVVSGSVTVGFNDSDNITNQLTINQDQQYLFDNELRQGRIRSR